ncbi:hypothetical protein D5F01_LYC20000 [Larimichthys crocea]|uniref:Uncharacterized protein n=1 Tax=Larimichthys crocea TaxID=215358 RepID=A0A6G0HTN9_LARCR|nr:hypothetical protein D5F01_LYC20000 [Larimichthys crocea]
MKALVKQRLTAAAQEIFELFERAVSEYEEQLCRLKEENERQRDLLDAVLKPELRLHRAGLCCTSTTHCTVTERPYVCSIYSVRVMGQEVELLHRWSCCTGGAAAQVELLHRWSCCSGGAAAQVELVELLLRWSSVQSVRSLQNEQNTNVASC